MTALLRAGGIQTHCEVWPRCESADDSHVSSCLWLCHKPTHRTPALASSCTVHSESRGAGLGLQGAGKDGAGLCCSLPATPSHHSEQEPRLLGHPSIIAHTQAGKELSLPQNKVEAQCLQPIPAPQLRGPAPSSCLTRNRPLQGQVGPPSGTMREGNHEGRDLRCHQIWTEKQSLGTYAIQLRCLRHGEGATRGGRIPLRPESHQKGLRQEVWLLLLRAVA